MTNEPRPSELGRPDRQGAGQSRVGLAMLRIGWAEDVMHRARKQLEKAERHLAEAKAELEDAETFQSIARRELTHAEREVRERSIDVTPASHLGTNPADVEAVQRMNEEGFSQEAAGRRAR